MFPRCLDVCVTHTTKTRGTLNESLQRKYFHGSFSKTVSTSVTQPRTQHTTGSAPNVWGCGEAQSSKGVQTSWNLLHMRWEVGEHWIGEATVKRALLKGGPFDLPVHRLFTSGHKVWVMTERVML